MYKILVSAYYNFNDAKVSQPALITSDKSLHFTIFVKIES